MGAIRIVFVAFFAAFAGVVTISLLLYRNVEIASFFPMVFAVPGALLVATAQAYALESGWPRAAAYIGAALLGVTTGAVILGVTGGFGLASLGAGYAAAIVIIWFCLDLLIPRWTVR